MDIDVIARQVAEFAKYKPMLDGMYAEWAKAEAAKREAQLAVDLEADVERRRQETEQANAAAAPESEPEEEDEEGEGEPTRRHGARGRGARR